MWYGRLRAAGAEWKGLDYKTTGSTPDKTSGASGFRSRFAKKEKSPATAPPSHRSSGATAPPSHRSSGDSYRKKPVVSYRGNTESAPASNRSRSGGTGAPALSTVMEA